MKILKKFCFISMYIVFILLIFHVIWYLFDKYYTQDVQKLCDSISVNIVLTQNGNNPQYGTGFFITTNKIVCMPKDNLKEYNIQAVDLNNNRYNITDINIYKYYAVLETDIPNVNNIKYLYGFIENDDIVKAHIEKNRYVNSLKDYKVLDCRYEIDSVPFIVCSGVYESKAGGIAIDKHGRILGVTMGAGDAQEIFYIYPQYEIMKQIIISDIKKFFGID